MAARVSAGIAEIAGEASDLELGDFKPVVADERVQFGAGENSGGGAGGAYATGSQRAAEDQARGEIFTANETVDVAGDECVAASRAVDELDGKRLRTPALVAGGEDRTASAAGDDHLRGPRVAEAGGLLGRIGQAGNRACLVVVGQEDVGQREHFGDAGPIVSRPWDDHVENGEHIYRQACAACHGVTGEGGQGGGAPLVNGLALQHIIDVTSAGRNNMPAFRDVFTRDELRDIGAYIVEVLSKKK